MSIHKKLLIFFISLLLLTTLIDAKKKNKIEKLKVNETFVKDLNATDFNEFDSSNSNYFLYFYAPWCGHCKEFNPNYDIASSRIRAAGYQTQFVKVNAANNKEFANTWSVEAYPTIFWVNKVDDEKIEYDGPRTVKGLSTFVRNQMNFTTEELPSFQNLESRKRTGRTLVFVGDQSKHYDAYKRIIKIAKEEDLDFFYWSKSEDFFSKFNIDPNSFDAIIFDTKNKTMNAGERLFITNQNSKVEIYSRD